MMALDINERPATRALRIHRVYLVDAVPAYEVEFTVKYTANENRTLTHDQVKGTYALASF